MEESKIVKTGNIIIVDPHSITGWITAIINGRWVRANVADSPSIYGINGGRINHLYISKTDMVDHSKPFYKQMDYSYDLFIYGELTDSTIDAIITELERLPVIQLGED
jgi:hypothetical protein